MAGEGTRLFDDVPKSYRLDLVSNIASSNGILELQYRAAPLAQRPGPQGGRDGSARGRVIGGMSLKSQDHAAGPG